MYCIKMQASAKTATMLESSACHLNDTLCIKDGIAHAHTLITSRDSSGKESRDEAHGSKSSWFQRLKPRDDMPTLEVSRFDKDCSTFERAEEIVRSVQPDCLSQSTMSRPLQNLQAECSLASKQQKAMEGKDNSEPRSLIGQEKLLMHETGKKVTSSAAFVPSETGFGPWVNIGIARRSETEKGGISSRSVIDSTTNAHELCKEAQRNPQTALNTLPKSLLISIQKEATASMACKSPSPIQSKPGLPPRPPGHKVSGSHLTGKTSFPACGVGRGAFHQLAMSNGQAFGALTLELQNREAGKRGEVSFSRVGPLFQNSKVSDRNISCAAWHNKMSTEGPVSTMMASNGGISDKQLAMPPISGKGTESVKLGQHIGNCSDNETSRLHEDDVRELAHDNVSSSTRGTGFLQLKYVDTGAETMKNCSPSQDGNLQMSNCKSWQPDLKEGSQNGKRHSTEQDAKASTSATSPWELFIEPAGASKIARDQFVEVYNRARDELKNQRLSQNTGRYLAKELEGGPKLTLGPSCAISDASMEGQAVRNAQQLSGALQRQEKNGKLEEQNLPHSSNYRKQDASTIPGSSQSKQAEAFQRVQLNSERPLLSTKKAVNHEESMKVSLQRMSEEGVVRSRELRTSDCTIAPTDPCGGGIGLMPALDQGLKCIGVIAGPGESCEQNNGQEAGSALGKRTRVTFEDHGLILAAPKVAPSRPWVQSKPQRWLQRWHSSAKYSSNSLATKSQVLADEKISLHGPQNGGIKTFRDEPEPVASGLPSAGKVKWLKASSSKVLPSAAAMAIVGTAARQFCASQPAGKGVFAFWSGFGMQTYRRVDSVQEKGKEKMFGNENKDLQSC